MTTQIRLDDIKVNGVNHCWICKKQKDKYHKIEFIKEIDLKVFYCSIRCLGKRDAKLNLHLRILQGLNKLKEEG